MDKQQLLEQWNKKIGTDEFEKEPEKKYDNTPIPDGKYVCEVTHLEVKPTKNGDKFMLSAWFKIVEGSYKNRMIFSNQVLGERWQINLALDMLRQLSVDTNVEFINFSQFDECVNDVFEEIGGNTQCEIDYSTNAKGYSVVKINEAWDK